MRDWLAHRVAASPDDAALVRAEDGETWTYTDLDRLVSETAGRLVAHGVEAGDRLGVLTPPYVGTVGLVHAAMRIGATFVPLGQELTPRELSERIERADLSAVVCADPTEDDALAAVDGIEDTPVFSVDDPTDATVAAVHDVEPASVDPPEWEFADHLCILFTSGTTGAPKPVPLTAGNVYSSAVASAFRLGVDPGDRWLVSLSLHHMGGLAPVYRSALYGTTLVLREGFDAGGTADDIDAYDVTGVSLVPTMLKRMLDSRGTLSDTLRVVLLGGAPAPDELIERCRDYSIPVYPTYGMTESASQIATATPRQTRGQLGTVGRPLFGTDVTVVDEDGAAVEAGETGEIVVDGPTVTPGYLERPPDPDEDGSAAELDRSAFGPHGLHTGDVGRIDEDGYLYVLNRLDDRIITGGQNVEPGEVTDVLRRFPAVEAAAVVGLDDETWGERVAALLAVEDADEPIDEAALDAFARERLSGFKIPRTIAVVDELPRTVSGTVDRTAVRETLRERGHPPDEGSEPELETAGFRPADPADPPDGGTEGEADSAAGDEAEEDSEEAEEGQETERESVDIADAEAIANAGDSAGDGEGDAEAEGESDAEAGGEADTEAAQETDPEGEAAGDDAAAEPVDEDGNRDGDEGETATDE
ncbi:o-succinylbenzoate--CoA ligase [Halorubrum sp. SD626R]|uniref:o-succinylbenzoate--CoA ligase n=1 Tax=Halorubrum sp. SD626R TaxID=1419722 RepID=UPI000B29CFDE|nr:o-succinylbenzoate--CoA ligase [Halorubrum sp. SD626R]TKX80826.1 o-succinylbenzoate--CoA ligase [Halorubrum sp. SD626R]